jgi:predicted lipid-binding transport protein (Tim44 family)
LLNELPDPYAMNSVFGFDIVTIIFLALAVFVFVKLRSVLGTRTGHERPPFDPYSGKEPKPATLPDKQPIPSRAEETAVAREAERDTPPAERWAGIAAPGSTVAAGLDAIASADRSFDARSFLEGAKAAYEMIVMAFAEGDRKTLRNMLGKELFEEFAAAINEREAKGLKMESRFVSLDKAEIRNAELAGNEARVTIDFVSQLVSATRDKDGNIVEGSADALTDVEDLWMFARDVKSSDPNWKLVENNEAA